MIYEVTQFMFIYFVKEDLDNFLFILQSGKTVLANFLADATDTSSGEYHPTQGCR